MSSRIKAIGVALLLIAVLTVMTFVPIVASPDPAGTEIGDEIVKVLYIDEGAPVPDVTFSFEFDVVDPNQEIIDFLAPGIYHSGEYDFITEGWFIGDVSISFGSGDQVRTADFNEDDPVSFVSKTAPVVFYPEGDQIQEGLYLYRVKERVTGSSGMVYSEMVYLRWLLLTDDGQGGFEIGTQEHGQRGEINLDPFYVSDTHNPAQYFSGLLGEFTKEVAILSNEFRNVLDEEASEKYHHNNAVPFAFVNDARTTEDEPDEPTPDHFSFDTGVSLHKIVILDNGVTEVPQHSYTFRFESLTSEDASRTAGFSELDGLVASDNGVIDDITVTLTGNETIHRANWGGKGVTYVVVEVPLSLRFSDWESMQEVLDGMGSDSDRQYFFSVHEERGGIEGVHYSELAYFIHLSLNVDAAESSADVTWEHLLFDEFSPHFEQNYLENRAEEREIAYLEHRSETLPSEHVLPFANRAGSTLQGIGARIEKYLVVDSVDVQIPEESFNFKFDLLTEEHPGWEAFLDTAEVYDFASEFRVDDEHLKLARTGAHIGDLQIAFSGADQINTHTTVLGDVHYVSRKSETPQIVLEDGIDFEDENLAGSFWFAVYEEKGDGAGIVYSELAWYMNVSASLDSESGELRVNPAGFWMATGYASETHNTLQHIFDVMTDHPAAVLMLESVGGQSSMEMPFINWFESNEEPELFELEVPLTLHKVVLLNNGASTVPQMSFDFRFDLLTPDMPERGSEWAEYTQGLYMAENGIIDDVRVTLTGDETIRRANWGGKGVTYVVVEVPLSLRFSDWQTLQDLFDDADQGRGIFPYYFSVYEVHGDEHIKYSDMVYEMKLSLHKDGQVITVDPDISLKIDEFFPYDTHNVAELDNRYSTQDELTYLQYGVSDAAGVLPFTNAMYNAFEATGAMIEKFLLVDGSDSEVPASEFNFRFEPMTPAHPQWDQLLEFAGGDLGETIIGESGRIEDIQLSFSGDEPVQTMTLSPGDIHFVNQRSSVIELIMDDEDEVKSGEEVEYVFLVYEEITGQESIEYSEMAFYLGVIVKRDEVTDEVVIRRADFAPAMLHNSDTHNTMQYIMNAMMGGMADIFALYTEIHGEHSAEMIFVNRVVDVVEDEVLEFEAEIDKLLMFDEADAEVPELDFNFRFDLMTEDHPLWDRFSARHGVDVLGRAASIADVQLSFGSSDSIETFTIGQNDIHLARKASPLLEMAFDADEVTLEERDGYRHMNYAFLVYEEITGQDGVTYCQMAYYLSVNVMQDIQTGEWTIDHYIHIADWYTSDTHDTGQYILDAMAEEGQKVLSVFNAFHRDNSEQFIFVNRMTDPAEKVYELNAHTELYKVFFLDRNTHEKPDATFRFIFEPIVGEYLIGAGADDPDAFTRIGLPGARIDDVEITLSSSDWTQYTGGGQPYIKGNASLQVHFDEGISADMFGSADTDERFLFRVYEEIVDGDGISYSELAWVLQLEVTLDYDGLPAFDWDSPGGIDLDAGWVSDTHNVLAYLEEHGMNREGLIWNDSNFLSNHYSGLGMVFVNEFEPDPTISKVQTYLRKVLVWDNHGDKQRPADEEFTFRFEPILGDEVKQYFGDVYTGADMTSIQDIIVTFDSDMYYTNGNPYMEGVTFSSIKVPVQMKVTGEPRGEDLHVYRVFEERTGADGIRYSEAEYIIAFHLWPDGTLNGVRVAGGGDSWVDNEEVGFGADEFAFYQYFDELPETHASHPGSTVGYVNYDLTLMFVNHSEIIEDIEVLFRVSKTVEGGYAHPDELFEFEMTFENYAMGYMADGSSIWFRPGQPQTFFLKDGESLRFDPHYFTVGDHFTIREIVPDHYTATIQQRVDGSLVKSQEQSIGEDYVEMSAQLEFGNNRVVFINASQGTTATGILTSNAWLLPVILTVAIMGAGAVMMQRSKRELSEA